MFGRELAVAQVLELQSGQQVGYLEHRAPSPPAAVRPAGPGGTLRLRLCERTGRRRAQHAMRPRPEPPGTGLFVTGRSMAQSAQSTHQLP